jgi:phage head maturation protease
MTTIERLSRPPNTSVRRAPFTLVRDSAESDDGWTLDGYGAVFNSPTIIDSWEGRFVETIAPGSMKRSFRERPPRVQFDHGTHPLIGSLPIGALQYAGEDTDPVRAPDGGAHLIAAIYRNWLMQPIRDAIASDPPGISGMSFRFEVVRESWTMADGTPITDDMQLIVALEKTWDGDVPDEELPIRTLLELKVPEIGPVMWPAYEATSVGVREGKIDLGRLQEPEQRKLLARALYTVDTAARGDREIDVGLREVRGMLTDIAARRERVSRMPAGFRNQLG